ncbi:DMT family transporter [Motiliproteus sediminis]|uniref:DMT family transporter n=1 Tax=Motiliproteus sediminis TaxID=1468178 RepID=UPI001FEA537A|nr:DMT family transporter [Motiliproteus sediminis]
MKISPGARFMLLSALGFALMAACVKAVSLRGIPVLEIVAARALVSLAISYIDVKRRGVYLWGQHKRLLIARGVVGALALMCVYFAVSTLPLAEAALLQFTYPAFTALLALIWLKERVQLATAVCIALSLVGLGLMVSPGLSLPGQAQLPAISVIAALLGAFGSAVAYVLVRRLGPHEDSSVIIFYFPLIALPVSVLLLGEDFVMPDPVALGLLLLVGIFTQVGQVGLTKAMAVEAAGKATAYSYVQVIFSALLGLVWFAEVPTLWTLLGGALIMAGALVNALWKR